MRPADKSFWEQNRGTRARAICKSAELKINERQFGQLDFFFSRGVYVVQNVPCFIFNSSLLKVGGAAVAVLRIRQNAR
jgi:hypothetical protein